VSVMKNAQTRERLSWWHAPEVGGAIRIIERINSMEWGDMRNPTFSQENGLTSCRVSTEVAWLGRQKQAMGG
jgi:hypothetical protein